MGSSKTNQGKKLQLGLICRYRGKIKARKKGFLDPACEEKTDARKSASLLSGEKSQRINTNPGSATEARK
jgi:hypothetical protein